MHTLKASRTVFVEFCGKWCICRSKPNLQRSWHLATMNVVVVGLGGEALLPTQLLCGHIACVFSTPGTLNYDIFRDCIGINNTVRAKLRNK